MQLPSAECGLNYWTTKPCRKESCVACSVHHHVIYEEGTLYLHPGHLTHQIRPWEYRRADAARPRITLQAFSVRCNGTWYLWW